jgi:hypothetical protein
MLKLHWILALSLSLSEVATFATLARSQPAVPFAQTIAVPEPLQLAQHRPRRRLGGRGGICVVAPGLLEQENNVVWSDRPLFLWKSDLEDIAMRRLEVTDQDGRILWEKDLATTDQMAIYEGQTLQPGQFYTWRLEWMVQKDNGSVEYHTSEDYSFQVMAADRRQQIATDLQTLTNQLQGSGASAETIAIQQADYLLNQPDPLWSDALKVLYAVENPSTETTQTLQTWINTACEGEES